MPFTGVLRYLGIRNSLKPLRNLFALYIIVLFVCFILAKIFSASGLWAAHTGICHTIFELICIFIAIFIFLVIWHTYERNSPVNHLVGFGFLVVALFDLFHAYYWPGLNFYPSEHYDLTVGYWILGRLTEAIVLFVISLGAFKSTLNKWAWLLVSLVPALGLSYLVLSKPGLFPVLFAWGEGLTAEKIILEYIIITFFLLGVYNLKDKINSRDMPAYRYIFMALLIAIPAELCFTFYKAMDSFHTIAGHILKITYYYYLFRGTFVSAVTYPYKTLEATATDVNNILDALPLGLMTLDNNLEVTYANKNIEQLLGVNKEHLTGLSLDRIFKQFTRDKNLKKPFLEPAIKTLDQLNNKIITIKHKPGINTKIKINVDKLSNWGYLLSLSEAKREQELENLQLQTKTILNAIDVLVAIANTDNEIIMCNRTFAETLDLNARDIQGMHLKELCKSLQFTKKRLPSKTVAGKDSKAYEVSCITPKGNRRVLHCYPAIIYDIDGENIGSITVASDVTNLKQEQLKLQQQEKLTSLGQMAAGIVHEIKNPLTTIKGFSQICKAKTGDPRLREYISLIEDAANQIDKIVSDFLSFAKPQPPALKEFSLNELIKSMQLMLKSLSSNKVNIKYILTEKERTLMADANQVKQVILNMVKNAIEAAEESTNPRVIISTGFNEVQEEMFLKISDNGKGMSGEEKLQAGTPFFTTKDNGTGLDLSICYQIIKEHGGRVDIESRPGQGTSFTVSLPCRETPQHSLPVSS